MSHYKSNVRDLEFNLFEVFGAGERMGTGPFAEMDADTAKEILHEVDRLAVGPLAETFAEADRTPPVYDPQAKTVTMPEGFKKSFRALMDSEWWRLDLPEHTSVAAAHRHLFDGPRVSSCSAPTPLLSSTCPAPVSPPSLTPWEPIRRKNSLD